MVLAPAGVWFALFEVAAKLTPMLETASAAASTRALIFIFFMTLSPKESATLSKSRFLLHGLETGDITSDPIQMPDC